jgi:hypothetical protein
VLPGTEEALKCKARYEEEMRQKALKLRHQDELRGLCEIFYTMESSIVEAVYESCDKQRGVALEQIMDMVGDTAQLEKSLRTEALRLNKVHPSPSPGSAQKPCCVRVCGPARHRRLLADARVGTKKPLPHVWSQPRGF